MSRLLASIALRLVVGSAVAWLLWTFMGAVGLAISAPLFGVLLARPLVELLSELRGSARALALSGLEGRHFEHRGMRIAVVEDVRHHRWLSIDDLRKLIPTFPRAAVLQSRFPQGVRSQQGHPGQLIDAEALLDDLSRSTEADSVRLRNWLEREVVGPAARARGRLGIRDEATDPSDRTGDGR